MSLIIHPAISRRSFLAGAAAAVSLPRAACAASIPIREFKLTAAPARWPIVGRPHPDTEVWCYGGRIRGPEPGGGGGEPIRFIAEKKLGRDPPVHCHGIRLPFAMDGVPGPPQPPIRPGESFTYEFTPPDAGTFWYHPHANSLQQLG